MKVITENISNEFLFSSGVNFFFCTSIVGPLYNHKPHINQHWNPELYKEKYNQM